MNIAQIKKIAREQRLAQERISGRPRAKRWGGKPTVKQDRRNWRKNAAD